SVEPAAVNRIVAVHRRIIAAHPVIRRPAIARACLSASVVDMRLPNLRRSLATSLRVQVLLLIVAVVVAVAVAGHVAFEWIVKSTIIQLGTLFAEKQVLFDRYRGLDALLREVSLAETLVGSATMRDWAADESSTEKRDRALAELERFRAIFQDHSYF